MDTYEKKYKEALSRAKEQLEGAKVFDYKEGQIAHDIRTTTYAIFPELAESEGERIRNWLIGYFHQYKEDGMEKYANGLKVESIIAWLEKQGEKLQKTSMWKHWKNGIAGNGEGEPIYLIKHGYTYTISSCLCFECDYIKLSELDKLLSEKQGEQKPTIIIPNFRVGDNIKTTNEESLTITKIDDKGYWSEDLFICGFDDAKWELVEQKPIDKADPKFKVGDWISGYYTSYQVLSINNEGYVVEDVGGNKINILFENEKFHHLWTIQDAKDGDVLYHKAENGIEFIVMSKGLNENNNIDSYFRYNSINGFGIDIPSVLSAKCNSITPATKEQRDLLFQKMHEAGYMWDSEKKELKNIEQNSAWSEEDEGICNGIINDIANNKSTCKYEISKRICDEQIKWLKSIKQRIQHS